MPFCKRIWAFFLMFLVIFAPNILCGYAEDDTELFNIDFESFTEGAKIEMDTEIPNSGGRALFDIYTYGSKLTVETDGGFSKAMKFEVPKKQWHSAGFFINISDTPLYDGILTLSYDMRAQSNTVSAYRFPELYSDSGESALRFISGWKWLYAENAPGTSIFNMTDSKDKYTTVKIVMDITNKTYKAYADGKLRVENGIIKTDNISKFRFNANYTDGLMSDGTENAVYWLDNIKCSYKSGFRVISSNADGKTDVNVREKIQIGFNSALSEDSFQKENFKVTADGKEQDNYTVTSSEDKKTAYIEFTGRMRYNADYTIKAENVKTADGTGISPKYNEISFKTAKFSDGNPSGINFSKKRIDFDSLPVGEITEKPSYLSAFSKAGNSRVEIVKDKTGNALKLTVPKAAGNSVSLEIPADTLKADKIRVSYDLKIENNSVFFRKLFGIRAPDKTELAAVSNGFSRINLNGDPGTQISGVSPFLNDYGRITLIFDYLTGKLTTYINSELAKETAFTVYKEISSLYLNIAYNPTFQDGKISGDGVYLIDNIEIQNCGYSNMYYSSVRNGEKNVETDRALYFSFTSPLSEASFTKENFKLLENGSEVGDYSVEYTPDCTQAVIVTQDGLKCDTPYTVKIADNLISADPMYENTNKEYEINFRTVPKAVIDSVKLYRIDGKIKAVTKINGDFKNANVITALYGSDGRLISANSQNTDILSEKTVVSYFDDTAESGFVKSYLWRENGISPVCEAYEKRISDCEVKPAEIFVAKNAQNGDGTLENPFGTIEEARDFIRTADGDNFVVNIREGEYDYSDSLTFNQNDKKNVVYRGYMDEKVIINGAYRLDASMLTPYKDGIYKMDLSSVPIDLGEVSYQGHDAQRRGEIWSELVVNGENMTMARYPNEGVLSVPYMLSGGADGVTPLKWRCDDPILEKLTDCSDLFVYDWFVPKYIAAFEKIGEVDVDAKTVQLQEFHKEENGNYIVNDGKTRSYYFVNALSLIDTEGEYYIDRENKVLYFYPPLDLQNIDMRLTSIKEPLIKILGAENITFRNLTISGGKGTGVVIKDKSKNINFDNVTIRNFGADGISYSPTAASAYWTYDSKIERSEIFDVGSKGINIVGGDNKTMTSCGIRIYDNTLHKTGRINMYQSAAVYTHTTSGNWGRGTPSLYVGYNEIYDGNDWAVTVSIDGTVEYNNIHDFAKYGDDTGAIYWGRNYYSRGKKLLNNYIHDIKTYNIEPTHGVHAVYLDGATGVTVSGNVIENADNRPIFSSDSGMHEICDNILISSAESREKYPSGANLAMSTGGFYKQTAEDLKASLPEYTYSSPLWISKYPYLARNLKLPYPNVPSSRIYRNYYVNCNPARITENYCENEFALYENNVDISANITFDMLKNKNFSDISQIEGFRYTDYSKIGDIKSKVYESANGSVIYSDMSELCIKDGKIQKLNSVPDGEKLVLGDITIVNPKYEQAFYSEAVLDCIRKLINMY